MMLPLAAAPGSMAVPMGVQKAATPGIGSMLVPVAGQVVPAVAAAKYNAPQALTTVAAPGLPSTPMTTGRLAYVPPSSRGNSFVVPPAVPRAVSYLSPQSKLAAGPSLPVGAGSIQPSTVTAITSQSQPESYVPHVVARITSGPLPDGQSSSLPLVTSTNSPPAAAVANVVD